MRLIYLIILIIVCTPCQGQQITAKNSDIVVVDGDAKIVFKDALHETTAHFICQDSVAKNMFYVHYEPWSSAVKTESILQLLYENGRLYVVGMLMRINMSEDIDALGESPLFLINGKEEVSDLIFPIDRIDNFYWKKHYAKKSNMLNCFILNSKAELIQKKYIPKESFFDYKLLVDIKNSQCVD